MAVYITMTILSAAFFMIHGKLDGYDIWGQKLRDGKKRSRMAALCFFILSALTVYLVMAVRYDVGTDYLLTYVKRFKWYRNPKISSVAWEPLYRWLFLLLGKITSDPQIVFIVTSALIVIPLWIAIKKVSPMPWLSVIIFVVSRHFFISMNAVRQYTALAFVMIAFTFIPQKCFWKYAVFVVLGALCHYSIILFLPLYLLIYLNIKPVHAVLIVSMLSVISPMLWNFIRWAVSLTPYKKYIGSEYDTVDRYNIWSFLVILFIFVLSILIIQGEPIQKDEHLLRFLFNLNIINTWYAFNINLLPNGERISWSLDFAVIILCPMLIIRLKDKRKQWMMILATVFLMAFVAYVRIYLMGEHEVFPYQTFFADRP